MFLIDDIADVFDVPKYDEYDNDYPINYDVDFLEQPDACSLLENDPSQQFKERIQSAYNSYTIEYEENSELVEGNPLPLFFSSFELLKEDFKIINKTECKSMQNHHSLLEQAHNNINWQQPSQVFNDLVADYMEDFSSQILQRLDNHEFEDGGDDELVSESTMSFVPTKVLLEQSMQILKPFMTVIS